MCPTIFPPIGLVGSPKKAAGFDETWFVTDVNECMENVEDIFAEREKIYGCKPEVSQTLVGITALVQPELKIEIKCIAYLNDE